MPSITYGFIFLSLGWEETNIFFTKMVLIGFGLLFRKSCLMTRKV